VAAGLALIEGATRIVFKNCNNACFCVKLSVCNSGISASTTLRANASRSLCFRAWVLFGSILRLIFKEPRQSDVYMFLGHTSRWKNDSND
jgi:hypothetical protein